ncbi:hypothetical protein NVP1262O_44 [Vibrio phage 1.262.O._10N.286.51.A9]|nr:hypothetical protein NVP1262O_44 [Vibrio phage 1.262.O._10N.286.51.A9]
MAIGIVNANAPKQFPKVIKQSDPVQAGMYKAVFNRFVTFGFHPDDYNEGKTKFYTHFGFELVKDMTDTDVPLHVREYDDGTKREDPKCVSREYALMDDMHHKSNGFMLAKALDPNVPIVTRGKENEHQYIVDFDWEANLGKTVLLQIDLKVSKAGNKYNKIVSIMPLGMPLEQKTESVYFNLYNPDLQEVWDKDVYGWEKKKITERVPVAGEPEVVYVNNNVQAEEPVVEHKEDVPPVDFDDDVPF